MLQDKGEIIVAGSLGRKKAIDSRNQLLELVLQRKN
jgi:hypothetical protein